MGLFNVYNQFDIRLSTAIGCHVYDDKNQHYLDLYGGHGVISIGHGHPYYVDQLKGQLDKIGFYSNAIIVEEQMILSDQLSHVSGYEDYNLFLCNSGAEANENALKLASFQTKKQKIVAFNNSFHGRTSAALNVTDNPSLSSVLNTDNYPVQFCELNDRTALINAFKSGDVAAVIVEGIQGVGGLDAPNKDFFNLIYELCSAYDAISIVDEIQSGFGRTGDFFAHQINPLHPDIITMAKGMGNGFPLAGLLIHPKIEAKKGMLGTTFGGNYLACSAATSVLKVIQNENLMDHVHDISDWLINQLHALKKPFLIKGRGLMLGLEFKEPVKEIQKTLLYEHHIFTGGSANPKLLRILPPLIITKEDLKPFIQALDKII